MTLFRGPVVDLGEHRQHLLTTLRLAPNAVQDPEEAERDKITPAFVDADTGETVTFAQHRERIALLAAALYGPGADPRTRDLPPNAVIAVQMPNSALVPLVFHSVFYAGHAVTPVSPAFSEKEVAHQLRTAKVAVLFSATGPLWDVAVKAIEIIRNESLKEVSKDVYNPPILISADELLPLVERGRSLPPLPFKPMTPEQALRTKAVIPFSSGTTGAPKAVVHTHATQGYTALSLNYLLESNLAWTPEAGTQSVVSFLPMSHVFGQNWLAIAASYLRAKVVIMKTFNPDQFLSLVALHRPRILLLVPPVVVRFINTPRSYFEQFDLSSVRAIIVGAAPMKRETEEALSKLFPGNPVIGQGYGLSEFSSPVRCALDTKYPGGSVGSLGPNFELLVISPDGKILGPNQEGEFWIRGSNRFVGYLGNRKATEETIVFRDGDQVEEMGPEGFVYSDKAFLRTGDVGYLNEHGHGFITDRLKELIKVNAMQVAPSELEALLLEHPLVADSAVIPIPSDRFGEVPKAFVVPRQGKTITPKEAQEIIDWCAGKTASYKRISGGLEVVREIPKSANGKVLRRVLKDLEAERARSSHGAGGAKL